METWRIMIVEDLCRRKAWHEQLHVAVAGHQPDAICLLTDTSPEWHPDRDTLRWVEAAQLFAALPVKHLLFARNVTRDWAQLQSAWPPDQRSFVVLTGSGHSLGPLRLCSASSGAGARTGTGPPDLWLRLDLPPSGGGESESSVRCQPAPLLVVCGSDHPDAPRRGVRWSCREDTWHLNFGHRSEDLQYAVVSFHFTHQALLGMQVMVFPPQ